MGMLEWPADLPDVVGLPEYRVTVYTTEIDGKDVRMAFGQKRFGHVEWLYTAVMPPQELLEVCAYLEKVAIEALRRPKATEEHLMVVGGSHH